MSQVRRGLPRIRPEKKGTKSETGDVAEVRGEAVSTVWLLPSIMAIWFANGSKRQAEPFLPTISLRFAAGKHSPSLVQSATLKCLESTFAYARANWFYLNPKYEGRKASLARHLIALSRIFNRNDRTLDIGYTDRTAQIGRPSADQTSRYNHRDVWSCFFHNAWLRVPVVVERKTLNIFLIPHFQLSSLYIRIYFFY